MSQVAVVMGSQNDKEKVAGLFDIFKKFGINFDLRILSAHRTPDECIKFSKGAKENGYQLILAVAGGAAHLAGVIASHTSLPVIGVPVANPPHNGMDAILSMIEMPRGIPVVAVGAGSGGACNAALFALRVLALNDNSLNIQYLNYMKELRDKVLKEDKKQS